MGAGASAKAALRLCTRASWQRGAIVAAVALTERVGAPTLPIAFARHGVAAASLAAGALAIVFAARGALQRSFATRTEAEFYGSTAAAVLRGDVVTTNLLPDEEARGSLVDGLHRASVLLADVLPNLVANVTAACVLTVVVVASLPLASIASAVPSLGLAAAGVFAGRRWVYRAQTSAWSAYQRLAEAFIDAVEGRLDVVAGGRERDFVRGIDSAAHSWSRQQTRAGWLAGALGRLPLALVASAVGLTAVIDARMRGASATHSLLDASLLVACTPPFVGIARCVQELITNEHRLEQVARIQARPVSVPGTGTSPAPERPTTVELNQVWFSYDEGHVALRGVSFSWRPGEILALAGPNGSGKSTCLRMLVGLGTPGSGDVHIGGTPRRDLDSESWRSAVSFLPQRPYLPPRSTILECGRFLDRGTAGSEMEAMLRRLKFGLAPHGLSSILEAKIASLSMGERQRVAIARALCRRSPFLVLDEPDANLDQLGVSALADILTELARERMILFVAHTPHLLRIAHRVLLLERGEVVSDTPNVAPGAISGA